MTFPTKKSGYHYAIQQARQALKHGDRQTARLWAQRAASLAPKQEEPWLIIAALASPRASLEYLKRALDLNPSSQHARKGMHWAIQRYRSEASPIRQAINSAKVVEIHPDTIQHRYSTLFPWIIVILALITGVAVWFGTPSFSFASDQTPNMLILAQQWVTKATYTPTITLTNTPTLTASPSPTTTPSITPTPTVTDTPTNTPTLTPTETITPLPTATHPPKQEPDDDSPMVSLPYSVKKGEIWIDVDLTNQQLQVYKGKNLLDTFFVSTGTWRTPTVTGQYPIYVKYLAADMAGPGYYLSNVPYVMYFYEGYGIHGTYWHNNFGTPMSHGCINLQTDNAEWVYNKASIGTVVNIHY